MPSTYTSNTGIEKPAQGEQSGSWGITINTNMDIIDRAINGVTTLSLVGTTSTLTTNDGSTSDGQFKILVLTGTLAAAHTITVDPADAQKIYYVKNETNQDVIFTQGTGVADATVASNTFSIVYADGSDECANLSNNLGLGSGGLSISGTAVTSTGDELNVLDHDTASASVTIEDTDNLILNDVSATSTVKIPATDIQDYVVKKADKRTNKNEDSWVGNTNDYVWFDASVGMRFYTAGAEDMRLQDNGTLHVDGDIVAYSTTISDERLKTDISKIDNALEKVGQLNGYTFNYKKDGRASAGVIAQEVEKVLPSAVTAHDTVFDGDIGEEYKTVQYDQLHGLLIEAIKELKAEVEALKNGG
jgi:hypothetical protein